MQETRYDLVPFDITLASYEQDDPRLAALYADIYVITLNYLLHICVIPRLEEIPVDWPPSPSTNWHYDLITTPQEARLVQLLSSDTALVCAPERSGQTDVLVFPGFERWSKLVFFLSSAQFALFEDELKRLDDAPFAKDYPRAGIFHARWRYRDVKHLKVVQFLEQHVFSAPDFSLDTLFMGHK